MSVDFIQGGREYVTILGRTMDPAPWSNVVGNAADFGFQVSETGGGYTWSVNSRENRLTPWSNDAVSDPPGEVVYLRDEDSGTVWSRRRYRFAKKSLTSSVTARATPSSNTRATAFAGVAAVRAA